jgi:V-type H+-transporting ATPase subunit a
MFQRQFTSEVKRCDEMERKVNYIKKEIIKDGGEVREIWNNLPRAPNPREFIDLEAMFEKTENEILELSENFSQLLQNLQELTELQYVLERTHVNRKFNHVFISFFKHINSLCVDFFRR